MLTPTNAVNCANINNNIGRFKNKIMQIRSAKIADNRTNEQGVAVIQNREKYELRNKQTPPPPKKTFAKYYYTYKVIRNITQNVISLIKK